MKILFTIIIIAGAAILLISSNSFLNQFNLQTHPNTFINGNAKYQLFALGIGVLVVGVTLLLNPGSKNLLNPGDIETLAIKEQWLGINGKTSWKSIGLQLLVFISLATFIFMFLGVYYTDNLQNFQWSFIGWVLLFSFTNSLTEELIFRFGVVGGLPESTSKMTFLLISAILFGLPHYFGNPGGPVGVIMSGVLGYILCKATLETKGLAIAWSIHFVQDVIIYTAIFMMNIK